MSLLPPIDGNATQVTPPSRSRASRIGRGALLALASVCIAVQASVIAVAGWAVTHPRDVVDLVTVWRFEPSAEIAEISARAAFSERGAFLFAASRPALVASDRFNQLCSREEPGIGVLGCYTYPEGRIYVFDITNDDLADLEVVVAAHEMLHAAWDRLDDDERVALEEPLEDVFASLGPDHELVERIASYEEFDPQSRVPELYAILGTEIADLPDSLEEHYAEFFADRQTVVALWSTVNAIFVDLEERLDDLSQRLESLASEIEDEQTEAERQGRRLEADITAFNARADRPGGYTSQSAFERDRNALIQRQSELSARIDATNAKIDEYNALVDEFTALNEEAAALGRDLNVDVERLEPTTVDE